MMYAPLIQYAIKIGGVLAVLLILYAYGNHQGREHVQSLWDKEKAATAIAANEAIMARLAENKVIESARTTELQKTKESYEKQISDLGKRPAGRLFIPKPADCNATASPPSGADTDGTHDPAGSVRLPEGVEQDLSALIDKADVIRIRLTALQEACK